MVLSVSDPGRFVNDTKAIQAAKQAVARLAGVSELSVSVNLSLAQSVMKIQNASLGTTMIDVAYSIDVMGQQTVQNSIMSALRSQSVSTLTSAVVAKLGAQGCNYTAQATGITFSVARPVSVSLGAPVNSTTTTRGILSIIHGGSFGRSSLVGLLVAVVQAFVLWL